MTFKVLIIEDNHSFIDSLKVMLRDLPIDFVQAFRYADAQVILEKFGVFHNRSAEAEPSETPAATAEAMLTAASGGKRKPLPQTPALYHVGGVFTIIIEQNTETSMKGTDFIAHAVKKFPGLSESDFVLLTHRMELVPARVQNYPILEKPLRAVQLRQIISQRIKQAQDIVEMQIRVAAQTIDSNTKPALTTQPKRKGLRDYLSKSTSSNSEAPIPPAKPVEKQAKVKTKVAPKKKAVKSKAVVKTKKPK